MRKKLQYLGTIAAAGYAATGGNIAAFKVWLKGYHPELGAVNIKMILMIFIGIVILYQLIPMISNQNEALQASGNVSTMGKWAGGLGEWLFPLLGIIALVFLLFQSSKKKVDGL